MISISDNHILHFYLAIPMFVLLEGISMKVFSLFVSGRTSSNPWLGDSPITPCPLSYFRASLFH